MATAYNQEYPLGSPALNGNSLTVDLMLKQPTRINQYISDMALKRFFADRIFRTGGSVEGGALIYNELRSNDLFATRGAQKVAPGAEFPEATFDRPEPKVAKVEKRGGKFRVTDEARDRNDLSSIETEGRKLGNSITRDLHAEAIATLEASITATGADVQVVGTSWADAKAATLTTTSNAAQPAADFAAVQLKAETFELGNEFNLWIVNPAQMLDFQVVYGDRWKDVLSNWNTDMIASNQVAAGSAYVVEERGVGEFRTEQPLRTTTWRDEATESTWVQTSIRALFAVTNPLSVLKVTGLSA